VAEETGSLVLPRNTEALADAIRGFYDEKKEGVLATGGFVEKGSLR
jgi:hypothetical protein